MTTENVLYKLDVSKDLSYKYDASGLRTGKTYNCLQKATLLQNDKTASLSDKSTETEFYYVNGNLHYQHSVTTKKDGDTFETDLYFYYDSNGYLTGIEYDDINYYPATNRRGDVVAIYDRFGNCVAKYEYDAWGKVISVIDCDYFDETKDEIVPKDITNDINSTDIAMVNPIRYRGYYYDSETGLYYLQSRYYNPDVGRFLNADGYITTGQGVLSYNMFAYCGNNPIMYSDPTGHFWKEIGEKISNAWNRFTSWCSDTFSPNHDVPLYNQGDTNLCWAYSQTMVEDSLNNTIPSQEAADARARELGEAQNGPNNWADPGWPTNVGEPINVDDFYDVAIAVIDTPIYAVYNTSDSEIGHMVVVTGVSLKNKTIFINNPWGFSGELTYDEFIQGFPGENESINDYTFTSLWDVAN